MYEEAIKSFQSAFANAKTDEEKAKIHYNYSNFLKNRPAQPDCSELGRCTDARIEQPARINPHNVSVEIAHPTRGWLIKTGRDAQK